MVMTGRYKPPSTRFIIRLEDLPGLEVVMRALSVGKLMEIAGLADVYQGGKATPEQAKTLMAMFADRLVSWNIDDDDDQPIPADLDGVMSLDPGLFLQIFTGWFEGLTQAPKVSSTASESGPELPPEVVSLPMATLQAVRAS